MNLERNTPVKPQSFQEALNLENILDFWGFNGSNFPYGFNTYVLVAHWLYLLNQNNDAFPPEIHSIDTRFSKWAKAYERGERDFELGDFYFISDGIMNSFIMAQVIPQQFGMNPAECDLIKNVFLKDEENQNRTISDEEKAVILKLALVVMEKGDFRFSHENCENTGKPIVLILKNWTVVDNDGNKGLSYIDIDRGSFFPVSELSSNTAMDRLLSFNLEVPSGRLIFSDFAKFKGWGKFIVKKGNEEKYESLSSIEGRKKISKQLFEQLQVVRLCTTTSFHVYKNGATLIMGFPTEEAEMMWEESGENPSLGWVCTDMWSLECVDEDQLLYLVQKHLNLTGEEAREQLEKYIAEGKMVRVEVTPGSYMMYGGDDSDVLNQQLVSPVIPQAWFDSVVAVISPEPITFTVASD